MRGGPQDPNRNGRARNWHRMSGSVARFVIIACVTTVLLRCLCKSVPKSTRHLRCNLSGIVKHAGAAVPRKSRMRWRISRSCTVAALAGSSAARWSTR